MNIHSAAELAVERYRRVRRSHWPADRTLVYTEGMTVTAGAMEGSVIGPLLLVQEGATLTPWLATLDDILAMNWELAP